MESARNDTSGKLKDDASLPKATMFKIIREIVPPDIRVARDSLDLLVECCVEFTKLISSESNDVCSTEDKRTISPEHVVKALQILGFGSYVDEVNAAYQQYRLQTTGSPRRSVSLGVANGDKMTEEEALAKQQSLFAEARARMNAGAVTATATSNEQSSPLPQDD